MQLHPQGGQDWRFQEATTLSAHLTIPKGQGHVTWRLPEDVGHRKSTLVSLKGPWLVDNAIIPDICVRPYRLKTFQVQKAWGPRD